MFVYRQRFFNTKLVAVTCSIYKSVYYYYIIFHAYDAAAAAFIIIEIEVFLSIL